MKLACLFILLLTGCVVPRLTRQATTDDIRESEARVKEQIQDFNNRQSKQWEAIQRNADRLNVVDNRLTKVDQNVWWLMGGACAAGAGGGIVSRMAYRQSTKRKTK